MCVLVHEEGTDKQARRQRTSYLIVVFDFGFLYGAITPTICQQAFEQSTTKFLFRFLYLYAAIFVQCFVSAVCTRLHKTPRGCFFCSGFLYQPAYSTPDTSTNRPQVFVQRTANLQQLFFFVLAFCSTPARLLLPHPHFVHKRSWRVHQIRRKCWYQRRGWSCWPQRNSDDKIDGQVLMMDVGWSYGKNK